MKHAFLKNNVVQLVDDIDEESYLTHAREWDAIINIEGMSPEPAKGWILRGNSLIAVDPQEQQQLQQIFGAWLALELVNKTGTRNLTLASQGQSVNVAAVLSSVGSIKALLETGALKTARTIIQMSSSSFPQYQDILNFGIHEISRFLSDKGWD